MRSSLVVSCLGFAILAAGPAAAQPPELVVRGGVRVGVLFSNVPQLNDALSEEGADVGWRYIFTFGGQVTMRLTDRLAFQPEVFYAPKGLRGEDLRSTPVGAPQDRGEFQVRLNYVDVPLLLRFHRSSTRGLYALVGPSFNINVSATIHGIGNGAPIPFGDGVSGPFNVDVKHLVKPFEAGFVAGAGTHIGMVAVEGRFMEGLTSIYKDADTGDATRNRSFAILAGVPFP